MENNIIRTIDDLGRISIPKDIRRSLRLHEGDKLALTLQNDRIILKKYSDAELYMRPLNTAIQEMAQQFNTPFAILDSSGYGIASAGGNLIIPMWACDLCREVSFSQNAKTHYNTDENKCAIVAPVCIHNETVALIICIVDIAIGEHMIFSISAAMKVVSKVIE